MKGGYIKAQRGDARLFDYLPAALQLSVGSLLLLSIAADQGKGWVLKKGSIYIERGVGVWMGMGLWGGRADRGGGGSIKVRGG